MELLAIIEGRWNPKDGLSLTIRKGALMRFLSVPPHNKYDVWGYGPANPRTGRPSLLLRGDARLEKDGWPFIMERGRKISGRRTNGQPFGPRIAEYLRDWSVA